MGPAIALLLGTASNMLADVAKMLAPQLDGSVQQDVLKKASGIFAGIVNLLDGFVPETPPALEEALMAVAEELKRQHDRIKFHDFGTVDPPVPPDPAVSTDPTEPGVETQGWG